MPLIDKKSIFSNLKTVDYFANSNATGFTKNKTETEYVNTNLSTKTYQYTGILSDGDKIGTYTPRTTSLENIQTSLLTTKGLNSTNGSVTQYSPVSFDSAQQDFIKKITLMPGGINGSLYYMSFGNGLQNSYASLLNIKPQTSLSDYYKLQTLSLKNNVSTSEPYIIREIGNRYSRSGLSQNLNSEMTLFRAGLTTSVVTSAEDALRIGKFLISARGLQFITKQVGLQLMNPRPETIIFNPLSPVLNAASQVLGLHFPRHVNTKDLFSVATYEATKEATELDSNRLKYLAKQLLVDSKDYLPARKIDILGLSEPGPGVSLNQHSLYGIRFGLGWPAADGYLRSTAGNNKGKTNDAYTGETGKSGPTNSTYLFKSHANIQLSNEQEYNKYYSEIKSQNGENFNESALMFKDKPLNNIRVIYDSKTNKKSKIQIDKKVTKQDDGSYSNTTQILPTDIVEKYNNTSSIWYTKETSYAKTYTHQDVSTIKVKGNFEKPVKNVDKVTFTSSKNKTDIDWIKFTPLDGANSIWFRAIVDTFQDSFSPSYTSATYVGNPINYPIYQNTKRTMQISFKVPIYYNNEMQDVKINLERLALYTYPIGITSVYTQQSAKKSEKLTRIAIPYLRFSFGQFIKNKIAVITSAVYTIDTNVPWIGESHTSSTPIFPAVINVSVGMEIIPDKVPYAEERKVEILQQLPPTAEPKQEPIKERPWLPPMVFETAGVDATATSTTSADGKIKYNNNKLNR